MLFTQLIEKKSNKKELSQQEIFFMIDSYLKGAIKDYQVSAMLMAIKLNGMTDNETFYLTKAMIDTGEVLKLKTNKYKIDKHSTGGIGDSVSIAVIPLLMAFDFIVFKMSGRGLGITGGTIDKLESIPKFQHEFSNKEALSILYKNNAVLVSQSVSLAPSDKLLYALRDVTATTKSFPLIVSSILSKKFSIMNGTNSKNDLIIIDLKCGKGSFAENIKEAKELKRLMLFVASKMKRNLVVHITNMDLPLGRSIGNSIEILEAMKIIQNEITGELRDIVVNTVATAIVYRDKISLDDATKKVEEKIINNEVIRYFEKWIKSQKGDASFINKHELIFNPKVTTIIKADRAGYFEIIDPSYLGWANIEINAGRKTKESELDYSAGIHLEVSHGDKVSKGATLFKVYSKSKLSNEFNNYFKLSYKISTNKPKNQKLFLG